MTFPPPAHFIINDSLTAPVENDLPVNRLSHWQRIQQLRQRLQLQEMAPKVEEEHGNG